jgi:hypothetical protein
MIKPFSVRDENNRCPTAQLPARVHFTLFEPISRVCEKG